MKLVVFFVAYLAISGAVAQRRKKQQKKNRSLGKRDALSQYINKLKSEGDGRYDPLFAQVISVKAQSEGLPDHMYKRVLNALALSKDDRAINNCDPSTHDCH